MRPSDRSIQSRQVGTDFFLRKELTNIASVGGFKKEVLKEHLSLLFVITFKYLFPILGAGGGIAPRGPPVSVVNLAVHFVVHALIVIHRGA